MILGEDWNPRSSLAYQHIWLSQVVPNSSVFPNTNSQHTSLVISTMHHYFGELKWRSSFLLFFLTKLFACSAGQVGLMTKIFACDVPKRSENYFLGVRNLTNLRFYKIFYLMVRIFFVQTFHANPCQDELKNPCLDYIKYP